MSTAHSTRLGLSLAGCLVLAAAWAGGPITPHFPSAQITIEQWSAYLNEIKAMPDARCEPFFAHQVICDSSKQRTIWVFTSEGHPAHPAVSRGVMTVQQTGQGIKAGIDRSGHYVGDRAAFYAWMKEFGVLDKREIARWDSMLQSK